jgi:hypothetical protein
VATAFIVLAAPDRVLALRTCAGLTAAAVGIASLGARLASRAQHKDALAFEKARTKAGATAVAEPKAERSEAEPSEEPATGYAGLTALGTSFLVLGPLVSLFGIQLAPSVTQLQPFLPVLKGLGVLAIAANPLAALEPLVGGPGSLVAQASTTILGVDSTTIGVLQLLFWGSITLVSIFTIQRAPEVQLLVPERQEPADAAKLPA